MGNNAAKCERGQFSEKQFEQLKATYALLASNEKLISEDTFVASFAKYAAHRKQFGRELSMFLKSSSPAIAENPKKAQEILKAKTIPFPSFVRGLERLYTRSESKRLASVLELFSWSIRLRSGAWLADTKTLKWTPSDVEHCLRLCLNCQHEPASASPSARASSSKSGSATPPAPPASGGNADVVKYMVREIFDAAKSKGKAVAKSKDGGGGGGVAISYTHLRTWVLRFVPLLPNPIQSYIYARYLRPPSATRTPTHLLRPASLLKPSPDALITDRDAGALSLVRASLQGSWNLLFDSARDGMSLNRLRLAVAGYAGPTVLVIQDAKTESVFGGCASQPWKESPEFFGDSGCFLFTLKPRFQILQNLCTSYANENYMYINETGFECKHGLGMGGTKDCFRLWIDAEDVDKCQVRVGSTYEPGPLIPTQKDADAFSDGYFTLQRIEVWGCGGAEAMKGRDEHRADAARMLDDMRKVDKMKLFKGAGNEFLFSKTRANARGATGDLGSLARD